MARPRGPLDPERTRSAVIASATHHFAEKGFAGTKLPELAREAGISAPSLLYHFGSKENLFDEVLRRAWADVRPRLDAALERATSPEEALAAAYAELFDTEKATGTLHAQISAAVLGQPGIGTAPLVDTLIPMLDAVADRMVLTADPPIGPPERVRAMVVSLVCVHASMYLLQDRVPDEVALVRENEVSFALALLGAVRSQQ